MVEKALNDTNKCQICCDNIGDFMCSPCGHTYMCSICANRCVNETCAICRKRRSEYAFYQVSDRVDIPCGFQG